MNAGTIQQIGTPVEIYREPKNLFVCQTFVGVANIFFGEVVNGKFKWENYEFEISNPNVSGKYALAVRPEMMKISKEMMHKCF
jgi:ABC-type spermidine/putrescine transport systems, ATPase components